MNVDDKVRIAGPDTGSFAEAHLTEVKRGSVIVTWSLRHDEERWAKSAVVRLENELKWVGYAMRD